MTAANEKKLLEKQLERLLDWQRNIVVLEVKYGNLMKTTKTNSAKYKRIYHMHEMAKEQLLEANKNIERIRKLLGVTGINRKILGKKKVEKNRLKKPKTFQRTARR